jgi:hypothetical protein
MLPTHTLATATRRSSALSETGSISAYGSTPFQSEYRTPPLLGSWHPHPHPHPCARPTAVMIATPDASPRDPYECLAERTRMALATAGIRPIHNDPVLRSLYADWMQATRGDVWLVTCIFADLSRQTGQPLPLREGSHQDYSAVVYSLRRSAQ